MFEDLVLNVTTEGVGYNFTEICEINQYKMLEATQGIPKYGFYLSLIMTLSLLFWFFIQPRYERVDKFLGLEPVRMVFGLSIFLTLILLYTALGLSESQLKLVELGLWGLLIVLGVLIVYKLYKDYRSK